MKRDYIRKAIFTVLMMATLCQSFPTYLFDDGFHQLVSLELDIDYENESESEKEEQNKKEFEETKDKIYNFSNYKTEIILPPPRTVA